MNILVIHVKGSSILLTFALQTVNNYYMQIAIQEYSKYIDCENLSAPDIQSFQFNILFEKEPWNGLERFGIVRYIKRIGGIILLNIQTMFQKRVTQKGCNYFWRVDDIDVEIVKPADLVFDNGIVCTAQNQCIYIF